VVPGNSTSHRSAARGLGCRHGDNGKYRAGESLLTRFLLTVRSAFARQSQEGAP